MGLNIEWVDPTDADILEADIWEDWIVYDEDGVIEEYGTELVYPDEDE